MTVAAGSSSFAGTSRLVSERIAETAASCRVTFGLYRNLDKEGTLALYVEEDSKYTTKIWTDPRTITGQMWTPVTVSVGRRRSGFRLVFISTHVGSTTPSDLSIDDFKYVECNAHQIGHCEGYTDPFTCQNGFCIHQDNVNNEMIYFAFFYN